MKYSIVEMEMKADVRLQAMIRRGDIFMAELPKGIGCEQGGRRPVVVIQNTSETSAVLWLSWHQSQARARNRCRPMCRLAGRRDYPAPRCYC